MTIRFFLWEIGLIDFCDDCGYMNRVLCFRIGNHSECEEMPF